jgi:peptidoglycan/xylan/chitin deacetylase (PgdA/CDA1 family)
VHLLYSHGVARHDVRDFRRLLEWLSSEHRLIGYGEAIERITHGPLDRAYVAFSFDDGFESCRDAAAVLHEFGVSACFFVCPDLVGIRDQSRVDQAFGRRGLQPLMTWDDLEALLAGGHDIGSHTMAHVNLAAANPVQVADEIMRSREVLLERLGHADHFAWPYGTFRHFTHAAATTVFATGFRSCASAVRGCHVTPVGRDSALCVRREHLQVDWPLNHVRYFLARSSRRASSSTNSWPHDWPTATAAMGIADAS